jgi:hypothetical protein
LASAWSDSVYSIRGREAQAASISVASKKRGAKTVLLRMVSLAGTIDAKVRQGEVAPGHIAKFLLAE